MIENNEGQASSRVKLTCRSGEHGRQGRKGFNDLSAVTRETDGTGLIYGPK